MLKRRMRREERKGVEVLEFVILMPIFVNIVLGIIEFGRAFEVSQWLTAAAREGARLAMLYNVISQRDRDLGIESGNEKVRVDVKNFLNAAGITDGVEVAIIPQGADPETADPDAFDVDDYTNSSGEYFTVAVSVPFDNVAHVPPFFMQDASLTGRITVRHE